MQEKKYDIAIIGAGILGSSLAYILSVFFRRKIILIEREKAPAIHSTTRNTGVLHRPFYIDPSKKKVFARAANISYFLWREMAMTHNLPWREMGTVEVSVDETGLRKINDYERYSQENGLSRGDYSILDGSATEKLEPMVKCVGSFYSKRDTAVSFRSFARELIRISDNNMLTVVFSTFVTHVDDSEGLVYYKESAHSEEKSLSADVILNVSGGESLRIAQQSGFAREYGVLHFRGDYWRVSERFPDSIRHNIYSVPRHPQYPFLDPHFVIRHDGIRELGPNAALVRGPYGYRRTDENFSREGRDLFSRPLLPKFRLLVNREFMGLVIEEWRSSLFKKAMAERARQFIPAIDSRYLSSPGLSGIRHSLIDGNGFVPEAVLIFGNRSLHVLNFNSPGATGAPAYASYLIDKLISRGYIESPNIRTDMKNLVWGSSIQEVMDYMSES